MINGERNMCVGEGEILIKKNFPIFFSLLSLSLIHLMLPMWCYLDDDDDDDTSNCPILNGGQSIYTINI